MSESKSDFQSFIEKIESQIETEVKGYQYPGYAITEDQHFSNQDSLEENGLVKRLETIYNTAFFNDKNPQLIALQATIQKELEKELSSGRPYAICVVDGQVDFLLAQAALCPPIGVAKKKTVEHILFTMAKLAAAQYVITEHPDYKKNLVIVSSQDAHRFGRKPESADALIMKQAYNNNALFNEVLREESAEISEEPNYVTQFGGHCVVGTVGASIFGPIRASLEALEHNGVVWKQFVKTTFPPKSAVLKKKGVDISSNEFRDQSSSILDASAMSYHAYFAKMKFYKIYLVGICADVCVKGAALELRKLVSSMITVVEFATFYLKAKERPGLEEDYRKKGVGILKIKGYASNGDDVPDINALLAFYLRYPKACVAAINLIAIAAVAIVALSYAVSAPIVASVAVAAAALAAVGVFYTRPAAEHKTLQAEPARSVTL